MASEEGVPAEVEPAEDVPRVEVGPVVALVEAGPVEEVHLAVASEEVIGRRAHRIGRHGCPGRRFPILRHGCIIITGHRSITADPRREEEPAVAECCPLWVL